MKALTFEDIFGKYDMSFLKKIDPDGYAEYISLTRAINKTASSLNAIKAPDKMVQEHNRNARDMASSFGGAVDMVACHKCSSFHPTFWPCELCFNEDGTPKKKEEVKVEEEKK